MQQDVSAIIANSLRNEQTGNNLYDILRSFLARGDVGNNKDAYETYIKVIETMHKVARDSQMEHTESWIMRPEHSGIFFYSPSFVAAIDEAMLRITTSLHCRYGGEPPLALPRFVDLISEPKFLTSYFALLVAALMKRNAAVKPGMPVSAMQRCEIDRQVVTYGSVMENLEPNLERRRWEVSMGAINQRDRAPERFQLLPHQSNYARYM